MKTELVAALVAALTFSPVSAQWRAEAAAGGTNHGQITNSGSLSAILGVEYQGPRWGYLTGGAPLDSATFPWFVAGVGQRLEQYVGSIDVGADVAGHAHAYRSRAAAGTGSGIVAELVPFVARNVGISRLELASGVRYYSNRFAGESESRAVADTNLRASMMPSGGVLLGVHGRYVRSVDGSFPFAGATVDVAAGDAVLSAHAGHWIGEVLSEPTWGANATVTIGRHTAVRVRYEQEAPDPLYWNPSRASWGLGISYGFGRRASALDAAPVRPRGAIQFTVPLSESADQLSIAGDFNGWEPVEMKRVGGSWSFTILLEPGVYHYAFQRADGSWFIPSTLASRVDDGFGGESAVLVVGTDGGE